MSHLLNFENGIWKAFKLTGKGKCAEGDYPQKDGGKLNGDMMHRQGTVNAANPRATTARSRGG